jgi:hypothetical protein
MPRPGKASRKRRANINHNGQRLRDYFGKPARNRATLLAGIPASPNNANSIGRFARVVSAIGRHGGDLGAVDIAAADSKFMTRDITVRAHDAAHESEIVGTIRKLSGVKVVNVSDRVFLCHLGGKISIQNKIPLTTRDALSMAYTPGVARVCEAIAADPRKAWQLTIKGNSVAVVSDGTAVGTRMAVLGRVPSKIGPI